MWKYESCDFETISLHDHYIDEIRLDDKNILLVFDEGFDIVKTHALNDTGKSKRTTASQVILRDGTLTKGIVLRYIGAEKRGTEEEIDLTWLLNFTHGIEVHSFNVEDSSFFLYSHEIQWEDKMDFLTLEFSCSEVLFCWNDYSEDAWFEGWPENVK
ncbi:MAG: hypothetical protein FWC72_04695 [Oscillospiraceae bacterium]|nr:hypothetical protein [Oscillospiraceae bacterium]